MSTVQFTARIKAEPKPAHSTRISSKLDLRVHSADVH